MTSTPLIQTETPHAARWFALHLFLADAAQADRFLQEWLAPRARQLRASAAISGWFFLRYWEGGPHLRVRFKDADAALQSLLLADAQAALPAYLSAEAPQREAYYANHFFDGQPLDVATLPWWDEGSVVVQDYAPEWRRYGGAAGLPVNEQLFETSSQLALRLLAVQDAQRSRSQLAAAHLLPFALALNGSAVGALDFLKDYAAYWQAASGARLNAPPALPPASPAQQAAMQQQLHSPGPTQIVLKAALQDAVQQWDALATVGGLQSPITGKAVDGALDARRTRQVLLASQLHMFNNRMGLAPAQEVLLARQLAQALTPCIETLEVA